MTKAIYVHYHYNKTTATFYACTVANCPEPVYYRQRVILKH